MSYDAARTIEPGYYYAMKNSWKLLRQSMPYRRVWIMLNNGPICYSKRFALKSFCDRVVKSVSRLRNHDSSLRRFLLIRAYTKHLSAGGAAVLRDASIISFMIIDSTIDNAPNAFRHIIYDRAICINLYLTRLYICRLIALINFVDRFQFTNE